MVDKVVFLNTLTILDLVAQNRASLKNNLHWRCESDTYDNNFKEILKACENNLLRAFNLHLFAADNSISSGATIYIYKQHDDDLEFSILCSEFLKFISYDQSDREHLRELIWECLANRSQSAKEALMKYGIHVGITL